MGTEVRWCERIAAARPDAILGMTYRRSQDDLTSKSRVKKGRQRRDIFDRRFQIADSAIIVLAAGRRLSIHQAPPDSCTPRQLVVPLEAGQFDSFVTGLQGFFSCIFPIAEQLSLARMFYATDASFLLEIMSH